MSQLDRAFGRQAFGDDPANYEAARPDYPGWVFERLRRDCGIAAGAAVLEIGAGTGKATRPLLDLGVGSLLVIEPDVRLADYLRASIGSPALSVRAETFEAADLPDRAFDLAISATAFHWLDEGPALARIGRLLKPGGWWAALWNNFGDDAYPDRFHEVTRDILSGPVSRGTGLTGTPFALDAAARIAAIDVTGVFERVLYHTSHWPLVLTANQTARLYATYSNVTAMPDREAVLAELRRIAADQFNDRVTRNMVTILYLARRAAS